MQTNSMAQDWALVIQSQDRVNKLETHAKEDLYYKVVIIQPF